MSGGSRDQTSSVKGRSIHMLTRSVLQLCHRMMIRLEHLSGHEAMLIELQIASMVGALVQLHGRANSRQAMQELVQSPELGSTRQVEWPPSELSKEVNLLLRQLETQLTVQPPQRRSVKQLVHHLRALMRQADYMQAELASAQEERGARNRTIMEPTAEPNAGSLPQQLANIHAPIFFVRANVRIGHKKLGNEHRPVN